MTQDLVMSTVELGHLRRQMEQSIALVAERLGELSSSARDSSELASALWHLSAAREAIATYFDAAFIPGGCRPPR